MLKFLIVMLGTLVIVSANSVPADLIKLKGSWTLLVSYALDPRDGPVGPAIHLILRNYSEPTDTSHRLEGDVIGFSSNTKIADVVCVNDENALYSRSDYICTYEYGSETNYLFVNDIDSTGKYFLGEYIVDDGQSAVIDKYNQRLSYVGMAVPKIQTVIIPMF